MEVNRYAIAALILLATISYLYVREWSLTRQEENSSLKNHDIKVVVVVDNNPYRPDLKTSWGVSMYVEYKGIKMLFDTGPNEDVLKYNVRELGISLEGIKHVIISHDHGDHTGGLPAIAGKGLEVYLPAHSSLAGWVKDLGLRPVLVNDTMELGDGMYIIGELPPIYEQALALKTKKGIVLLVGCSHPGVDKIAKKATKELGERLFLVIGGFHTSSASYDKCVEIVDTLVELGAEKIYPIHCSGNTIRKVIEERYPNRLGDGGVGLIVEIIN